MANRRLHITRLKANPKVVADHPLVLIHGWGCSSEMWSPIVEALNNSRDLILVDLPGAGESANITVDDVNELLRQLSALLPKPCYLLGWSLGGMLATQLALQYPAKVLGLVTLATNLSFVQRPEWKVAMANDTFRGFCRDFKNDPAKTLTQFYRLQARGDQNHKAVLTTLKSASEPITPGAYAALNRQLDFLAQLNNVSQQNRIRCPGLHLFGENDSLVPATAAQRAYRQAPSQQVKVYADTGHAPHISQPDQAAADILEFVSRLEEEAKHFKNKVRIARSFSKAAKQYDRSAKLQKKVAKKLAGVAGNVDGCIVDLGSGTGFVGEFLNLRHATALIQLDLSTTMLSLAATKFGETAAVPKVEPTAMHYITGDMECLPFGDSSIDHFISSLSVQWSNSFPALLKEVMRTLRPGGRFVFSTLGPGTLRELKVAWQQVDAYVHVNQFSALINIEQQVQKSGFELRQKQSETEVLTYPGVVEVMRSIKDIGAHNVNAGQSPGLTSKNKLRELEQAYERFRRPDNNLPASWEIHYLELRKSPE